LCSEQAEAEVQLSAIEDFVVALLPTACLEVLGESVKPAEQRLGACELEG
jgi:hypothetical protein